MAPGTLAIRRIDSRQQDAQALLADLRERLSPRGAVVSEAGRRRTVEVFGQELTPLEIVERICDDVRERGVEAVLDYSQRIDGAELTRDTLRVTAAELSAAHAASDPQFLAAIRRIRDNILVFQTGLVPRDYKLATPGGGYLMARYTALARVGICVPGGAAAYPSTVLMTAVPAQAAGVEQLAIVAPPTKFGAYNSDLLATCHELGIREVYRCGGAQAVAALAYGVEGLPKVDKIVGPGNLFVALAKKRVYGDVDIDSIAGPSEVVVIADGSPSPAYIAADLIAQAEHAPGSSILISWSGELLEGVAQELEQQTGHLSRGDLARQSLEQFGALIRVRDSDEAVTLANEIAPEHLHLAFEGADSLLAKVRNAAAIFVGPYSPVAVGDYVAGPSHVLPTGGTARFASGLSARDFVRSSSVIHFTREDLARSAADLRIMAEKEGLTAHRASVDIRLDEMGEPRSGGTSPN
jgi:histidinol dehydrogenase